MAQISDLPNELLFNIAWFLITGHISDVRALLHLCRVSRQFCGIAQPALYTCVRMAVPVEGPLKPLKLFFRTIIERPPLAQKTRKLALLDDWGHLHYTAEIGPPHALVRRLHELRVLNPTFLSKLKTFHLNKQWEDGPVDIHDYIPFMEYPSFEKFSSENDVPDTPDEPYAINTLTRTAADLAWWSGAFYTMRRLLDACPRLTAFELIIPDESRYAWHFDRAHQPVVTPRELVKALLDTHRQNLKSLTLDFHHIYDLSDPNLQDEIEDLEDCNYTYPSFRGFKSLSHMSIEFEKLNKASHLPASLETLNLRFCRFDDLNTALLSDLVYLKYTWCPIIRVITVTGMEVDEVMQTCYVSFLHENEEATLVIIKLGAGVPSRIRVELEKAGGHAATMSLLG
ncbi:predicted protein [Pyrenophora tritici-repentis Pt-1C-BFP]|uniref:Uncharacterized protein n=1 Tax=Pyrenophora tritici-repentis (strain Pt-1C-BFP) TaxID=426418 RepID=B2W8Q0_PYRTR|nr:uncharacterized protein PTRG_06358 [Pyrenophora tritici-repentis Pt-1C-BFP]EDU49278.1 predicted protein [Pyrenophora tritici-repentis Pt-1C-BFP]